MSPSTPNQASLAANYADLKYVGKSYDPEKASVTIGNELATAFSALSLPERNLLALAISRVHKADEQLRPVVIELDAYRRIFLTRESTNNSVHAQLRSACRELTGKDARLYSKDGTGARVRLVVRAALEPSPKSGLVAVSIELHPDLSQYLINLSERGRFTSVPLTAFTSLRGHYSIPLLLLLHARKGRQKRFVTTPALADLRDWLGVREGSYPLWQDFKTRILQTAIADLAGLLQVTFTGRKWGRSVARVEFKVTVVAQETTQTEPHDDLWSELQALLDELQFKGEIDRYIRPLGVGVVHAKVLEVREVIRAREAAGDPVKNPGGYLRNSLDNLLAISRYQPVPKSSRRLPATGPHGLREETSNKAGINGRKIDVTAAVDLLRGALESERHRASLRAWENLSQQQRAELDRLVARRFRARHGRMPAEGGGDRALVVWERKEALTECGLLTYTGPLSSAAAFDAAYGVLDDFDPVLKNHVITSVGSSRFVSDPAPCVRSHAFHGTDGLD